MTNIVKIQPNVTALAEVPNHAIKLQVRREDGAFNLYFCSGEPSKIRIGSLVDDEAVRMFEGFIAMMKDGLVDTFIRQGLPPSTEPSCAELHDFSERIHGDDPDGGAA